MNKKLVAAALGMAFAAPVFADASNVTLYGRVHSAVVNQKFDGDNGNASPSNAAIENYSSRLGVRGVEDLGGGLSAVFGYEFGVNSDTGGFGSGRHAYVGLKSGLGTFMAGQLDGGSDSVAPLYNQAEKYLGSANNNAGDLANVGGGGELVSFVGLNNAGTVASTAVPQAAINRTQRTSNSIGYKGSIAGVEVIARHALGGTNDDQIGDGSLSGTPAARTPRENDLRQTEVAANYKIGALELGAGYQYVDRSAVEQTAATAAGAASVESVFQIGAKYTVGALTIGGLYGQVGLEQSTAAGRDDSNAQYGVHGDYKIGNGGVYGQYSVGEREDLAANAEVSQLQIAYYYDFSKRTRTYVGFNRTSLETGAGGFRANGVIGAAPAAVGANLELDSDSFVVGLRHNF
ncbi:MAG TPA: porin [Limnobacter sp.]|nr:porin [Limnobacter sp.]